MAARTSLRSPVGVNHHELPSGLFRLLRKHHDELTPTGIGDRLSQAVVAQHPFGVKVFYRNDSKPVNNAPRLLVDEVMPAIGDTLMDTGNDLLSLSSFGCSLFQLRQVSLSPGQSLLVSPEEPRICYPIIGRKSSEALQPHIDSHRHIRRWQWLRLVLSREAGIPFVILTADSAGADFSKDRPMQLDFNITHFSQFEASVKLKPELGIGEALISVEPLEPGIARFFSGLHSPEKGTKGFVQSIGHILKNLGVDIVETEALCFELRDSLALFEIGKRFLLISPGIPALLQKFVVQPATLIKLRLQKLSLRFGRIESIFKSFIHYFNGILNEGGCQAKKAPHFNTVGELA